MTRDMLYFLVAPSIAYLMLAAETGNIPEKRVKFYMNELIEELQKRNIRFAFTTLTTETYIRMYRESATDELRHELYTRLQDLYIEVYGAVFHPKNVL